MDDSGVSRCAHASDKPRWRISRVLDKSSNDVVSLSARTLRRPDTTALARLGLRGDVLLVQADFALAIRETALAPDAGDFDGDSIPIHVSLILRKQE